MPGRAGERDGVQAAGPGADPLPGPSGGVPGDRVRRRSRLPTGRALLVLLVLDLFRHFHRASLFPAADTEAGCPQSPGREAGIPAGVLEATACDPSKPKPTRQTT
jgi:hypothetical protein